MPMKPDDLKDLAAYRKALGIELSKTKENPAEFRYLPKYSVGGKIQPVLIVGPLSSEMKGVLSTNQPKAVGTCQLVGKVTKFEVRTGSFKEGTAVQAIKAAGLTNTVEIIEPPPGGEVEEKDQKVESQEQAPLPKPKVEANPEALKAAQELVAKTILKRHQDLMQTADDKAKKRLATAMNGFKAAAAQKHGAEALARAQEWLQLVAFLESGAAEGRMEGQRLPTARQLAQRAHARWFKLEPVLVGLIDNPLLAPKEAESLRGARATMTKAARDDAKDFAEKLSTLESMMKEAAEDIRELQLFVSGVDQKAELLRARHKMAYYQAFSAKDDQELLAGKRQAFELHFKIRPVAKTPVLESFADWFKAVGEIELRNQGRQAISPERETRRALWMSYWTRHDEAFKNAPKILHQNLQTCWDDVNGALSATDWNASGADAALEKLKVALEQAEEAIKRNAESKIEFAKLRDVLTRAKEYAKVDAEVPQEMSALAVEANVAEKAGNYVLALGKVKELQPLVEKFPGELAKQFEPRLKTQEKAVASFKGKLTDKAFEELSDLLSTARDQVKELKKPKKDVLKAVKAAEQALIALETEIVFKEDDVEQLEEKRLDFGVIEARHGIVKEAWEKRLAKAPDVTKEREAEEKLKEIEDLWQQCREAFKTRDFDELLEALMEYGTRFLKEVAKVGAQEEAEKAAQKAKKELEEALLKPMKDAVAWGNGIFSTGTIGDIWAATVSSLKDKGLESIGREFSMNDASSLIPLWANHATGNSGAGGILSNLHVPGNRPQPKWVDHDIKRDEIQVNFCAYFRNRKTNIHVTVEPNSYFQRYPRWDVQEIVDRKVIWKRLSETTKQLLRDNYSGVLSE